MRHLKKIRETDAGPIDFHWFHDFFYFFTNADFVTIKDETFHLFVKPMEV